MAQPPSRVPEATQPAPQFMVTGAKGCIGAWVVRNLVRRGNPPVIFDVDDRSHRLSALLSKEEVQSVLFVRGDVTRFSDLECAVGNHGITHIIHLAAFQVPACAAQPIAGGMVNVIGTLNVFEAARRRRDLVKQIVYASSAAVYGPEEFYGTPRLNEGAPLHPGTHYGVFKQCNEGNARVYFATESISSIGLRPWAVYGVGRDQGLTSGPTKAIKAAVLGQPYTIGFTGGLDLQYVQDTAGIFLRCAESGLDGARVYTLRGTVIQTPGFIETLAEVLPPARGLIRAEGKQLPMAYDLDDSALVRDLGEVPRTPLEAGIRETMGIFTELHREGRLDTRDLDV